MLIQLIAVEVGSLFLPLLAMAAKRVPMKMGMVSFKVMTDVAIINILGVTVAGKSLVLAGIPLSVIRASKLADQATRYTEITYERLISLHS